jgi:starch synthase
MVGAPPGQSPRRPLKVLFTASEVAPFRKTGGLADVAGALPKALRRRGIDARVVMPLYQGIPWHELERLDGHLNVPMYFGNARAGIRLSKLPESDVPIYFVEYNRFFDRPFLYGSAEDAYSDNLERFAFFSRASLEMSKAIGFVPDIVHAHDWQTALVPVYLNTFEWSKPLHGAASIMTIHNLAYQGVHDPGGLFVTGLGREHYNPGEFEHFGALNLLKAGIRHSTMLSTVSETYCREIQTSAFGCGLDGELAGRRADLWGIVNGIDVDEWDPATDRFLPARFGPDDLAGKARCKAALQERLGLPVRPEVPLLATIGRLTYQKGYDVLAQALHRILGWDVQLVLLGTGDRDAEQFFSAVSHERGQQFRSYIGFDNGLAHLIEAGADFFIMPSRFEPCGLNQMYSMRYGTLPIVRNTGGLADTVDNYDERSGTGTGFKFNDLNSGALADTVGWAISTYHDRKPHFDQMRQRAMTADFTWDRAAATYERLYLEAYQRRRGHAFVSG